MLAPFAAAALVALAVLALDRPQPRRTDAVPAAAPVHGSFKQTNSLAGAAIFSAGPIGPGNAARGSVTITNAGTLAGSFRLEKRALSDTPGPGGGALSERLRLRVRDSRGRTIYSGALAGMPARPLGRFAAGERRGYDFTATLPDGGAPASPTTGDNAYALSSMSVGFVWKAAALHTSGGAGGGERPDGGGSGPPPPPGDATPPRVRVRIPRVQRLFSRRRLTVYVRCSERCRVTARGSVPTRSGRERLRSGPKRLRAHRRGRMYFHLSRRARRSIRTALRHRRQITIRLRFTARDRAGNARSLNRRLHLRGR